MKYACLILVVFAACGGSPKVVINSQQDFDNVVVDVIKEVIAIFDSDGINCQLLTSDLRGLKGSQKVAAAKDWMNAHPDAKQSVQPKINEHRAELDKASAPGTRQCGVTLKTVFNELSQ